MIFKCEAKSCTPSKTNKVIKALWNDEPLPGSFLALFITLFTLMILVAFISNLGIRVAKVTGDTASMIYGISNCTIDVLAILL